MPRKALRKALTITKFEPRNTRLAWRFVAWALLFAIVLMTVWPFELSPVDPFSTDVGRIEAYGILAAAFVLGLPKNFLFAVVWPIGCAMTDELLPVIAGAQHFNLADTLWKTVGVATGISVGWVWNNRFRYSED